MKDSLATRQIALVLLAACGSLALAGEQTWLPQQNDWNVTNKVQHGDVTTYELGSTNIQILNPDEQPEFITADQPHYQETLKALTSPQSGSDIIDMAKEAAASGQRTDTLWERLRRNEAKEEVPQVAAQIVIAQNVTTQNVIAQNVIAQNATTQNVIAQKVIAQNVIAQNATTQNVIAQNVIAQNATTQNVIAQNVIAQNATTQNATAQNATPQNSEAQNTTAQNSEAQNTTAQNATAQNVTAQNVIAQNSEAQNTTTQRPVEQPKEAIKLNESATNVENVFKNISKPFQKAIPNLS